VVVVVRVLGSKAVDPGSNRGFPALHGVVEGVKEGAELGRDLVRVHGAQAYLRLHLPACGAGVANPLTGSVRKISEGFQIPSCDCVAIRVRL
jgi:hypothetical protein